VIKVGEKMDVTLQEALQHGKANPKMKRIWMLRWSARFIFFLIFFMVFIIFRLLLLFYDDNYLILLFMAIFLPIVFGLIIAYIWADVYWKKYSFEVGPDRIIITRGVIGKRVTNIPYERVQNVNIWRGVLDRIFGLYAVQIETAGGSNVRSTGGYGTRMATEGSIQGLTNPEPIADYIIAKSKGSKDLGDKIPQKELEEEEKMRLLEERFLKGEISEDTYQKIKNKYE